MNILSKLVKVLPRGLLELGVEAKREVDLVGKTLADVVFNLTESLLIQRLRDARCPVERLGSGRWRKRDCFGFGIESKPGEGKRSRFDGEGWVECGSGLVAQEACGVELVLVYLVLKGFEEGKNLVGGMGCEDGYGVTKIKPSLVLGVVDDDGGCGGCHANLYSRGFALI